MIIYATTRKKERCLYLKGEEIKYKKMENNLLWK